MQVKVCGMKYPENISAIAALRPDYMGFIFFPRSSRYIGDLPDPDLFSVSSPVRKVGVFVDEKPDRLIRICRQYGFEIAQLHGGESPEYCREIRNSGIEVLKAFSIDEAFNFEVTVPYASVSDYFLFDTKGKNPGGNGQKFGWSVLDRYKGETPFFLSGGIQPGDIRGIRQLRHPKLYAVDINSGFETAPGRKAVSKVACFINDIKANKKI